MKGPSAERHIARPKPVTCTEGSGLISRNVTMRGDSGKIVEAKWPRHRLIWTEKIPCNPGSWGSSGFAVGSSEDRRTRYSLWEGLRWVLPDMLDRVDLGIGPSLGFIASTPLAGHNQIRIVAPETGTDQPLSPIGNGSLGAVSFSHF